MTRIVAAIEREKIRFAGGVIDDLVVFGRDIRESGLVAAVEGLAGPLPADELVADGVDRREGAGAHLSVGGVERERDPVAVVPRRDGHVIPDDVAFHRLFERAAVAGHLLREEADLFV